MTALESHLSRIDRADSMEALGDIARDIEALMHAEGSPRSDKDAVADAVMEKTQRLARVLAAG